MPRAASRLASPADSGDETAEPAVASSPTRSASPVTSPVAPKRNASIRKMILKKDKAKSAGTSAADGKKGRRRKLSEDAKARKRKEKRKEKLDAKSAVGRSEAEEAPDGERVYNGGLKKYVIEWEVEKILDSKLEGKKNRARFYLVKWIGYPKSQASWEPEVNLHNSTEKIAEFDEAFPHKP